MVLGLFLAINAKANHYNVQLNLKLYDNALIMLNIQIQAVHSAHRISHLEIII